METAEPQWRVQVSRQLIPTGLTARGFLLALSLNQGFPNILGALLPWFYELIPSAPYPVKTIIQKEVNNTIKQ